MMTDEILQKNITAIVQYNLFNAKELLSTDFSLMGDGVTLGEESNETQIAYFRYGDRKYLLHSRYDPRAEAERITADIEETRDYLIVVFGIGLGYHLTALKNKISADTRVIIVEHNVDVLKYALTHVDLSDIFNSGKFLLVYGDERQIEEMTVQLAGLNFYNLVQNIKIIALPNYYVYGRENKSAIQNISSRLLSTVMSFGNDLQDHFVGFANMCHNTGAIIKSNSVEEIKDKYKGIPAIIVAAGPSLDKNIRYLKNANGKALIISCDASMRACERHGVRPEAIASIERDEPTYTFYYKDRKFPADLVLIAPGSLWPAIYEEYPGKTIIMSRNDIGFERMWLDNFDNFKFVGLGHSCATVAFTAAREAGCNPIILVGQDLAYTEGKKHSDLTHTEYEGENDDRDSTGIYLEDHEGNLLKSHIIYKLFKEWFEMQIFSNRDLQVIDATEGGAYIKGTTLMTLQEAITKYCHTPMEKRLGDFLTDRNPTNLENEKKYTSLLKTVQKDLNLLKKVKKEALIHLNLLVKLEKIVYQDCDNNRLEQIVQKMQRGDKIIKKIMAAGAIESYYKQIIIQTIAQVKKIGNTLTLENVRRNHLLQHNLMFMIVNSTDLIIQEYSNAQTIIEEQQQQLGD